MKIKNCPHCRCSTTKFAKNMISTMTNIRCSNCGMSGPVCISAESAVKTWNSLIRLDDTVDIYRCGICGNYQDDNDPCWDCGHDVIKLATCVKNEN